MSSTLLDQLAKHLDDSRCNGKVTECLTVKHPELTLKDAYQIQQAGIILRERRGEIRTGYKMGLTSRAKQEQMHVSTPIFGVLTNKMAVANNDTILLTSLIQPKIEPEIAFILGKDLKGRVSPEAALAACSGICAALDIIDSRYIDFKFTLIDIVADNCSAGGYVLGPIIKPAGIELADLSMSIKINGSIAKQGSSSAILGNPVNSLVMLAEMLDEQGEYIKSGSIVLSGTSIGATDLKPHLSIANETERLGTVTVLC